MSSKAVKKKGTLFLCMFSSLLISFLSNASCSVKKKKVHPCFLNSITSPFFLLFLRVFFYSCFPALSVSDSCENLQQPADATLTRSDAITGSQCACMDVAQWHTHMTYYHWKPNAGRAVTDTLTWICCGSKVTAPSVKQPHIYYNSQWHDVQPAEGFEGHPNQHWWLKKSPYPCFNGQETKPLQVKSLWRLLWCVWFVCFEAKQKGIQYFFLPKHLISFTIPLFPCYNTLLSSGGQKIVLEKMSPFLKNFKKNPKFEIKFDGNCKLLLKM